MTDKKEIDLWKKEFNGRNFKLKKWCPPKDNLDWSHDHCEICNKSFPDEQKEGYNDDKHFYWLCKKCFDKFKDELNLK